MDGSNSPKRPRRTYGDWELNRLETVFALNSYPDREHRNTLAREMGVSPKNIQIWFQNRRARARQLRRKATGIVENPIERMRLQWSSTISIGSCSAAKLARDDKALPGPEWTSTGINGRISDESLELNKENIPPLHNDDGADEHEPQSVPVNITSADVSGRYRFSVSNLSEISNSSFGDTLDEDLFAETFLTLFSPGVHSQINFDF